MPHLPKAKPKQRRMPGATKVSGHNTRRQRDESDNFYNTTQWRKLRAYHIKNNPICRWCDEEERVTPAKVVDHIIPIKQGGDRTAMDNLQSLCERCHAVKSAWDRPREKKRKKSF